jgi:SAM-dependent methyltransferase
MAAGFQHVADAYERGRAGWPPAAIERLISFGDLRPGDRVLDLAAGTGKLTRELLACGLDVVTVDPSADMRRVLAALLPPDRILAGEAEALPLDDGAVAAVAVGDAFHWFDGERAVGEIARVLRPGGTAALLWHRPMERLTEPQPWRQELRELLGAARGDSHPAFSGEQGREAFTGDARFTPFIREGFAYEHPTDRDGLIAEAASLAYIAVRPEPEREALLGQVAEILDRHDVGQLMRSLPVDLWLSRRA